MSAGVLVLNNELLWDAGDNKSCYAFGGSISSIPLSWIPNPVDLWQLTSDGTGGGNWSKFNVSEEPQQQLPKFSSGRASKRPQAISALNSASRPLFSASAQVGTHPIFDNLTRPDLALGATVDGTGFILGGVSDRYSARGVNTDQYTALGGIVAFNMTSNQWSNTSMPSSMVRPTGRNGILASVPNFGPQGLLIAMGIGVTNQVPIPFETITIYDPESKTWHNQTATGDISKGRDKACTVGIQGDNGTFEMYVCQVFDQKYKILVHQTNCQVIIV